MKRKFAKILRKFADRIYPQEGTYLPPLGCRVGELKRLSVGYQYPKGTTSLNFDDIRLRLTQLLSKGLLDNGAILFTINDSNHCINTIEASIYVKRPENIDGYKEL